MLAKTFSVVDTKAGARAGKYKSGARAGAGGQANGWGPGNTNTLQNSYSQKFSKFRIKTPVLESLFNKRVHRCFSETFLKSFADSPGKFLCCSLFLKNSYAGVSL